MCVFQWSKVTGRQPCYHLRKRSKFRHLIDTPDAILLAVLTADEEGH